MRRFFTASGAFALVCIVATTVAVLHPPARPAPAAPQESRAAHLVLSAADTLAYTRIFDLQRQGKWPEADALMHRLEDPLLLGHVLAERYLHPGYRSSPAQLVRWLRAYDNLPQAKRIHALARSKGAQVTLAAAFQPAAVTPPQDTKTIRRFGRELLNRELGRSHPLRAEMHRLLAAGKDGAALNLLAKSRGLSPGHYDLLRWSVAGSLFNQGSYAQAALLASASADRSGKNYPALYWLAGIAHWHQGNTGLALGYFRTMERSAALLPASDAAAASFWAYRAAGRLGKSEQALLHLERAAENPATFYGIQAAHALQRERVKRAAADPLTEAELAALARLKPVRRALALAQLGQTEEAAAELASRPPEEGLRLARYLELPLPEIAVAQGVTYPLPGWHPSGGYGVDPALVFAIARQESGFNASARSHAGAVGVMQLMPETTRYLLRHNPSLRRAALHTGAQNPALSLALGQTYLNHLKQYPAVRDNLIYLIASYNAGPGKLAKWRKTLPEGMDPLLFIESIPYIETRAYVQHVLANYWIYRRQLGKQSPEIARLTAGIWPSSAEGVAQLAAVTPVPKPAAQNAL